MLLNKIKLLSNILEQEIEKLISKEVKYFYCRGALGFDTLANDTICLSEHRGCMHKRNRYMVDNSNYCICCLTEEKDGTAYTVSYAKKQNLKIINLANLLF